MAKKYFLLYGVMQYWLIFTEHVIVQGFAALK